MNLIFIADTEANVRKLNRESREFRQWAEGIAHQVAPKIALEIVNSSLTDNEKDEAFFRWALLSMYCRVQMVRSGQQEWGFPEHPFCDAFLDLYMKLPFPGTPKTKYILLSIISEIGDWALQAISKDEIKVPDILNDLAEIKAANSASIQQVIKDFAASCDPTSKIPTFSKDETIERIANSLAKPFVAKANRAIDDGESRWNDALLGVWKGSEGLLKRAAMEIVHEAFTGDFLANYLCKAVRQQLGKEIKKIQKDRAQKKAEGYTEIIEADLGPIEDKKGNIISPQQQIEQPDIPDEDRDLPLIELKLALQPSDKDWEILTLLAREKTKVEVAKELGISRPAIDRHLKAIQRKLRNLPANEFGISLFREDGTFKSDPTKRIPDPTAYQAMVNIMREELLKLTR